jgi:transcriptional regulator GlxA family with amidase domain
VLAETGLLDHRAATTHWAYERLFKERYPRVKLQVHQLVTNEGDLFCAGGAHAGIDLCLYLLARFHGKDLARRTAKVLVHDLERVSQLPYASLSLGRKNGDRQIQLAQEHIEETYNEPLDMGKLAKRIGLGRRTLERNFKKATGETPLSYLQNVRIEAAKRMLEDGALGFEEITARVGYEDISSFRKLFVKRTGLSPFAYRKKFTVRWPGAV